MVAPEFSLHDIVGVELSAPLANNSTQCRSDRATLSTAYADSSAGWRCKSGSTPAGNLVPFLYNPFAAEAIARIAEAVNVALTEAPRTVYVVYYNPVVGHRFDASPLLRRTVLYFTQEHAYGPDTEDPIIVWEGGTALIPIDSRTNARIEIIYSY